MARKNVSTDDLIRELRGIVQSLPTGNRKRHMLNKAAQRLEELQARVDVQRIVSKHAAAHDAGMVKDGHGRPVTHKNQPDISYARQP